MGLRPCNEGLAGHGWIWIRNLSRALDVLSARHSLSEPCTKSRNGEMRGRLALKVQRLFEFGGMSEVGIQDMDEVLEVAMQVP